MFNLLSILWGLGSETFHHQDTAFAEDDIEDLLIDDGEDIDGGSGRGSSNEPPWEDLKDGDDTEGGTATAASLDGVTDSDATNDTGDEKLYELYPKHDQPFPTAALTRPRPDPGIYKDSSRAKTRADERASAEPASGPPIPPQPPSGSGNSARGKFLRARFEATATRVRERRERSARFMQSAAARYSASLQFRLGRPAPDPALKINAVGKRSLPVTARAHSDGEQGVPLLGEAGRRTEGERGYGSYRTLHEAATREGYNSDGLVRRRAWGQRQVGALGGLYVTQRQRNMHRREKETQQRLQRERAFREMKMSRFGVVTFDRKEASEERRRRVLDYTESVAGKIQQQY